MSTSTARGCCQTDLGTYAHGHGTFNVLMSLRWVAKIHDDNVKYGTIRLPEFVANKVAEKQRTLKVKEGL